MRLEDATLHVRLVRGEIAVEHGPAAAPDLVVETGNEPLLGMLARLLPPEQAIEAGLVEVDGDERLLTALLEAIPFPAVTSGG